MAILTVNGIARVHYDSDINKRRHQADYVTAIDGAWALGVAVCDGAGDNPDAAEAAQMSAQIGAAVAASTGSGTDGIKAARYHLAQRNHDAPFGQEGITTAVIAAITHGGIELAWCGDSPAWAVCHDGAIVPLTDQSCHPLTPCSVEFWHDTGPHRRFTHTDDWLRIIIATDGVTSHLPASEGLAHAAAMIDDLSRIAAPDLDGGVVMTELRDNAKRHGGRDNITVAVIDLLRDDTETN
ncbi:protein phosphatase 2C domain-containing protein [Microbispora sp. NBRC 16548]|uniref:PP2C family protein-serine/threonine phosphatase n=1 Tax=Microbispora sp. NBRC 16548 TaxID=3030994 RepID=UPI0016148ECB|nr:protein phosphatase 2C domain-containing protein [Microbispora sp. NBRC 16548]GLX06677.1 hypothetical protein Misp03_36040 [Microbispora sp. NBRC 16548]